jgi:hypothetical protein
MSLQTVLETVPKPARTTAYAIVICAALIGLIGGIVEARLSTPLADIGDHFYTLWTILGIAAGLFIGCLFAIWVLGLGYVYADARNRNMPHIPWVLIAAIVPNLLGFLLYFVLRKPLASPCPQCGQPIAAGQRFCPSCGCQALPQSTAAAPPQPI